MKTVIAYEDSSPSLLRARLQLIIDAHAASVDHLSHGTYTDTSGDYPVTYYTVWAILTHRGARLALCPRCDGSKEIWTRNPDECPDDVTPTERCPKCGGTGTIMADTQGGEPSYH